MSFNRIDVVTGIMLQSEFSSHAFSYSHACYQEGDSVRVALTLPPGDSLITFQSVSVNDLNYSNRQVTNATTHGNVRNYCTSPTGSKLYVESDGKLFQFDPGFTLNFERNLMPYSFSMYNRSSLLFDQNDNPVIFNSYVNNTIINDDLIFRRIDHNSGNTIDSLVYNDARNTPDIAITQFYDSNNKLNLVYANDFDDAFILQEETQLNIIQLDPLVDLQNEIPQVVIKMYPNPASTKLTFSDKDLVGSKVMLYDAMGKSLKAVILNSEPQIDISDLKTGIYFLQIKKENDVYLNTKFIKIDN